MIGQGYIRRLAQDRGQEMFDAIVAPTGGDYTLPSTACAIEPAGSVIGIAPGTYTEIADIDMKAGQVLLAFGNSYGSVEVDLGATYQITTNDSTRLEGFKVTSTQTAGPFNLIDVDGADDSEIRDMEIDITGTEETTVFQSGAAVQRIIIEDIDIEGNGAGTPNKLFDVHIHNSRISNIRCDSQIAPVGAAAGNMCEISGPASDQSNIIENFQIQLPLTQGKSDQQATNYVLYLDNFQGVASNIILENLATTDSSCNAIYINGGTLVNATIEGFCDDGTNSNIGLRVDDPGERVTVNNVYIRDCHICLFCADTGGSTLSNLILESGGNEPPTLYSMYITSSGNMISNVNYNEDAYISGSYNVFINIVGTEATSNVEVDGGDFNQINNWTQDAVNQVNWTVNAGSVSNRFNNIYYNTFTDNGTLTIINNKLTQAVAPTANEDVDDGILVGDKWYDTTTGILYECRVNTAAGALWDVYGAGSPGFNFVTDIATPVTCASGNQYDNTGAGGAVVYNLPACARGLEVRFVVLAAQNMVVTAAAGDQIHANGFSSTVAGTATSNVLHSVLELNGMNATDWVAVAVSGSWTFA